MDIEERLKGLKATRVLIDGAENGKIKHLWCEMPGCYCPRGRGWFMPVTSELSDWMPTNDHYPKLACEGGHVSVDNSRLAHRLCNRVDYARSIGRPIGKKDLARVEAEWARFEVDRASSAADSVGGSSNSGE